MRDSLGLHGPHDPRGPLGLSRLRARLTAGTHVAVRGGTEEEEG
jgi:hypothetical protein